MGNFRRGRRTRARVRDLDAPRAPFRPCPGLGLLFGSELPFVLIPARSSTLLVFSVLGFVAAPGVY
jgi:hypothetical protein